MALQNAQYSFMPYMTDSLLKSTVSKIDFKGFTGDQIKEFSIKIISDTALIYKGGLGWLLSS